MDNLANTELPPQLRAIQTSTDEHGFNMASEVNTGALLRFLCATKPAGRFLELGTGTGLATSWIVQAMDPDSSLISVDNDNAVLDIARRHLGDDTRVEFMQCEGIAAIRGFEKNHFDLIFADAWDGKYYHLDETLSLLKHGGIYIVDDMLPQDSWPEGHQHKADELLTTLENRADMYLVKMRWASGLILGVKKELYDS